MSAFQPINTHILKMMADTRTERMNVKCMLCSLACHALVLGILFYGAISRGMPLPPPVEDGILSMHVVDAGSGSMHVGPKPVLTNSPGAPFDLLPQQAGPEQPREKALPEPLPELVPIPFPNKETFATAMKKTAEPKPSEKEIRHSKQEPLKRAVQKAPPRQPRVANASASEKTHGVSTASQGKTMSKGAGLGQGTGSGNFASRDSGSNDGQAQRTTLSFLMAQLERYKKYPMPARRLGLEGVVNVLVIIDGKGLLQDLRRADEKAHPILQKATDQMLAKVRANWKNQAAGQAISIVIPIRYTLRDG